MNSFYTYTQVIEKFEELKEEHIKIFDIAHSLANSSRFNGHTPTFYSIAEHSVLVQKLIGEQGLPIVVELGGLLHDAHECYTGDVIRPVLDFNPFPAFQEIAKLIQEMIEKVFTYTLTLKQRDLIQEMDDLALEIEGTVFFSKWNKTASSLNVTKKHLKMIRYLNPNEAELEFLEVFENVYSRYVAKSGVASKED